MPLRAWSVASTTVLVALAFLLVASPVRADLLVLQPGAISRGVFGEVARLHEESGVVARGFRPDNEGCPAMWLGADGSVYVAAWLVGYGVVHRYTPAGDYVGKVADVAGVRFLAGATMRDGRVFLIAQIDAANGGTGREIWQGNAEGGMAPRRLGGGHAGLNEPTALAANSNGDLIVADGRAGIVRVDPAGGERRETLAAVEPEFGQVSALAFDAGGALYFASASHGTIRRIRFGTRAGGVAEEFVSASEALRGVAGLAFDRDGDLYASDPEAREVRRFDGTTGAARGVLASFAAPARPAALGFVR